jgi:hypothetical protein
VDTHDALSLWVYIDGTVIQFESLFHGLPENYAFACSFLVRSCLCFGLRLHWAYY